MSVIEDFKWIRENYKELAKKYNKRWIAVRNKEIIEVGNSLKELKEKMKGKGDYIFEYITTTLFPSWDRG